jgi:hypothetical protein
VKGKRPHHNLRQQQQLTAGTVATYTNSSSTTRTYNTPTWYQNTASTHLLQLLAALLRPVAPALQAVAECNCSNPAAQTLREHQAAPPAAAAAAQQQPQQQQPQQQQQQVQVVQRVLRCSCQAARATHSTSCCHTLLLLVVLVLLARVLGRLDRPQHQLLEV